MSSEVFRLKLRNHSVGGEVWLFKDNRGWWYTTGNPKNTKIPSFATEEAAWKMLDEVRQHWPFEDVSANLFVVRVVIEDPIYDGPRHTSWDRLSGDSDAF